MKLIVGLGNPGREYAKTRHNVGFMVLDSLSESLKLHEFSYNKKFNADTIKNTKYVLLKPQTFMNNSGEAVLKALNFYKISANDMIILQDEIDIPFGEIRASFDSTSAGHNGVESIIDTIGTKKFTRVRIGILSPEKKARKTEDFVLQNFSKEEEKELSKIINKTVDIIKRKIL